MTNFTVIGAGMAGLLAAAVLRDECLRVVEAQPELPNNHSALLRFRSSIVGDTLNIPFRSVKVIKAVQSLGNPVADAVSYSLKTNGTATLRSLVTAQGEVEQRFIAPPDLIQRMRKKVTAPVEFGTPWDGRSDDTVPVISTLPMPLLMRLLGYEYDLEFRLEFRSVTGYTTVANLKDCDLCATIYIPSRNEIAYRASITGNRLIVEYAFPENSESWAKERMERLQTHPKDLRDHLHEILELFGMSASFIVGVPEVKKQQYAKILPIDDEARKRFMLWATEHHNIYSLGRFATWRPGLLMDDLVNDIRAIQKMANGGTSYDARRG